MLQRVDTKKQAASRYRHFVSLQYRASIPDDQGGFTYTWATITGGENVPVEILPMSAQRRAEYRSYNVIATHHIRYRYGLPIDEIGRVLYGSRVFNIHTVEDIQTRSVEYLLVAEEVRP